MSTASGTTTGRGSPVSTGTAIHTGHSHASHSPFASYAQPSALQHHSTHLTYAASPSLTGELLRQALSEFLRTQVCHVTQIVCLYGFNSHSYEPDDDIPIQQGKLCYAVITQCELILVDRRCIGEVRKRTVGRHTSLHTERY